MIATIDNSVETKAMSDVTQLLTGYVPGTLELTKLSDTRFRLEGNWSIDNGGTDHQQMIYEALEIAAHSNDKFKLAFKAMCEEYLELTKDWVD